MKILWLTWKDRKNPLAGGAEVVNEELARRLADDGHEVVLLVGGFAGGEQQELIDGYRVIRVGSRWTVYWYAYRYYKKYLKGWADLVIDEVNTMPFFAKFYVRERNILFVHMLCRQIWFYQLPQPFSLIGYLLEPLYLRLLSDRQVITVSESTKQDLTRHGFSADKISIISEGIEIVPIKSLDDVQKYETPTLLSLGAIRPMKQTLDQIKAFEVAKATMPDLRLKIAGEPHGAYGNKVLDAIKNSKYSSDIEVLGKVTKQKKIELMQRCHALLVTSIKEGWGLVVTEAASQGTPAIVYDVDGLRDSVKNEQTGFVSSTNTPHGLAKKIQELFPNPSLYKNLRQKAWEWSKQINFQNSYQQFKEMMSR